MRLKPHEIDAIKTAVREAFGDSAVVRLFGSRTDDSERGGDIDLLIEADASPRAEWRRVARFRDALFRHIDEQKVDVVLIERGKSASAFARMVAPTSVSLQ